MALFSERHGYIQKPLQFEEMSPTLKNRIWNIYYCLLNDDCWNNPNRIQGVLDHLGISFEIARDGTSKLLNMKMVTKWFSGAKWYRIYDFVEIYFAFLSLKDQAAIRERLNKVLQEENAGYRVSGLHVIPITNEGELQCIEAAQETAYHSVNIHFQKAVELYSKRPVPDYENTIKEAISAVEAMCCIITDSKKATLGDALKRLESKGIKLHKALQNAMSNLYGYTSDESGIRHGSIDFTEASSEDAKYMLITCSAFVNYLIEKWSKANPER